MFDEVEFNKTVYKRIPLPKDNSTDPTPPDNRPTVVHHPTEGYKAENIIEKKKERHVLTIDEYLGKEILSLPTYSN